MLSQEFVHGAQGVVPGHGAGAERAAWVVGAGAGRRGGGGGRCADPPGRCRERQPASEVAVSDGELTAMVNV